MSVDVPEFDYAVYEENQRQFPPEELHKYAGLNVAFSLDGACILASGKDINEVERKLAEAGIDASRVVHSYVFPPDESIL